MLVDILWRCCAHLARSCVALVGHIIDPFCTHSQSPKKIITHRMPRKRPMKNDQRDVSLILYQNASKEPASDPANRSKIPQEPNKMHQEWIATHSSVHNIEVFSFLENVKQLECAVPRKDHREPTVFDVTPATTSVETRLSWRALQKEPLSLESASAKQWPGVLRNPRRWPGGSCTSSAHEACNHTSASFLRCSV